MAKLFLGFLMVLVIVASVFMLYRAKDKPARLRMVLYTKLGWAMLGAVTLLWLILSGRLVL